jgi:drug/metabolite transporter (DMT)-like permease
MWLLFILLSTVAWALVNIFNSVLVHHHHKSPVVLSWTQSVLSIPLLAFVGFKVDIQTPWAFSLLIVGMSAYVADLWFFHVAHSLDISVVNNAWSILALLLTIVGVFYFHESWTFHQSIGAILILIGTLLLTLYHQHINLQRTLCLLIILAALYVPYYVFKKVSIDAGAGVGTVFFWLLLGREIPSILLPLTSRKTIQLSVQIIQNNWLFPLKSFLIMIFYFLAEYFGALAYQHGSLSLVAIVANTQPFVVIGFAGIYIYLWPKYAPKELFSRQSLGIKLTSFGLVFLGLIMMPPQ